MAYDYSPQWLQRNQELVSKLIQIAGSGEVLHVQSDMWQDVKNRQHEINNALASMARNMPAFADIRQTIRTWTDYRHEQYHLYVGRPQQRVSGRPGRKESAWTDLYQPVGMGDTHIHDERITDQTTLTRFVGTVTSLAGSIGTVTARVDDLSETALDFFKDIFEHHNWSVSADGEVLTLKRITK